MPVSNGTPISLVTQASESEAFELATQLKSIGYSGITVSRFSNQNITRPSQTVLTILQVKHVRESRKEILHFIQKIKSSNILLLFQKDECIVDNEITDYSKEVSTWPCNENDLAYRMQRLSQDILRNTDSGKNHYVNMNILGNSKVFTDVVERVYKISKSDVPTLIEGETGTGKEVIARALHYLGARESKPFIAVNCGALPDSLIENELFGHEQGAFTDAKKSQSGIVKNAEGGTLFLDEIEALSAKGQIVLLRYLQDFEYRPLGSHRVYQSDLRLITASNENLQSRVNDGTFRQDLFFRLNIMNINLPPLRERGTDVQLLARHFLNKLSVQYGHMEKTLSQKSMQALQNYSWPGNVRELENFLHREFLLCEGYEITAVIQSSSKTDRRKRSGDRRFQSLLNKSLLDAKQQLVNDFESEYLKFALSESNGNISEAARIAGKERRTFTKLLSKYGINKNLYKSV